MALTKSVEREYATSVNEVVVRLPVAASTKILRGAALEVNAGGYVIPVADGGDFGGFAMSEADNTSGANGDLFVDVKVRGAVVLDITSESVAQSAIASGTDVEATDDDTFRLETASAITGTKIGKPIQVVRSGAGGAVLCYFEAHFMRIA